MNKYLFKEKKKLFLCFVDFSKAFDTIWTSIDYRTGKLPV